MNFTIRKKVLVCSLLPLVLLGAIVILVAATIMKGAIIQQVENSLRGTATATQAAYDQNTGSYLETKNGDVWKGSYNISQSDNLVDTIKEESGMEVTFFYGNKRIMTSAKDKDGNRILQSEAAEIDALQLGYKIGFINDSQVWLLMLKKYNTSVYSYNEDEVDEMIMLIHDSFVPAFTDVKDILLKKLEEVESDWM